jgi:hypothetical protein
VRYLSLKTISRRPLKVHWIFTIPLSTLKSLAEEFSTVYTLRSQQFISPVATACKTYRHIFKNLYFTIHNTCYLPLNISTDYFPKQHLLTAFCRWDGICTLCGRNWICVCNLTNLPFYSNGPLTHAVLETTRLCHAARLPGWGITPLQSSYHSLHSNTRKKEKYLCRERDSNQWRHGTSGVQTTRPVAMPCKLLAVTC